MSLWSVDDAATQLFMTQFFSRLQFDAEGRVSNKHQAFTDAQRFVRHYTSPDGSHPYGSPDYWCAFVLLDAY